jgi:hypothetical protein
MSGESHKAEANSSDVNLAGKATVYHSFFICIKLMVVFSDLCSDLFILDETSSHKGCRGREKGSERCCGS